jgi:hypothetical protein
MIWLASTRGRVIVLGLALSAASLLGGAARKPDALSDRFLNPPQSYGIRCWWWWLNGNVSREAITRDLEQMKAKGFSGACIVDAGGADQRENKQVPEGPMFGSPEWRELYRHALAEASRLGLMLSLNIQSGWNLGGPDIAPEEAAKHLTWAQINVKGPSAASVLLPLPAHRDGFYHDIAVYALPARTGSARAPIRDLEDKAGFREVGGSAADTRYLLTDVPAEPGDADARVRDVQRISEALQANGALRWEVPPGEWTVIRMGFTTSPARVSTSSGKWQGRVIDYLSERHFMRYWNTHIEPLLQDAGPLVGTTLRYLQTDSWELGGLNWTDNMAEEFRSRRGYDAMPYLPIIAGCILEGREISNRFLADWRKTIGDLVAERHYAIFAREAARHKLGIQPESAGPHLGLFDGLRNYGYNELMTSEFWVPSPHRPTPERRYFVKQAASAAHIYGRTLVGAEAFTSIGPHWDDVLWTFHKPSFDHEICSGLNLVFVHTFTCSPKEMGLPGQEYFAGTHFNPNVTWWDLAGGFIRYLTRVQFMSQQGRVVTDALYYCGDHVPNVSGWKEADPARVLPGYDYDTTNEEVLLTRASVKKGSIVLPHGQSYRILVLPDHKVLSLAVLRKARDLVRNGATVLGAKPERTVSLVGYPECNAEFKHIADEVWGADAGPAGERRFGRGRVVWGLTGRELLARDGLAPDFEVVQTPPQGSFDYIHRITNGIDYYFVSSQNREPMQAELSFRIRGRKPELWDPMTGRMRDAAAFVQRNGRIILPIQFDPYGSVFVVFRKSIRRGAGGTAASNADIYEALGMVNGPWDVRFDPKWGAPELVRFNQLVSWIFRPEEGVRFYSGRATYQARFDFAAPAAKGKRLLFALNDVRDVGIARVTLNGKELGITWSPPFRVEIAEALKAQDNVLEIEVANSWRNRLVGDRDLPEEKRFTKTNITTRKEWELLDSGLLGPVQILAVR